MSPRRSHRRAPSRAPLPGSSIGAGLATSAGAAALATADVARTRAVADPERLAALRATGLLDAPGDEAGDRGIRLAARLLRAPVGLISLVDEHRDVWLSATGALGCGIGERGTMLRPTFCQEVVATSAPVVVPDTRRDATFARFPAVEALGVAAYAGVPLILDGRHVLGSFCVVDTAPHAWTEMDVAVLRELAAAVVSEVERRRAERALRESEARYRALLDSLPVIVYRVRPTPPYEPFYVSPGVERLGYAYEEWLARPDMWLRILHPEDKDRVLREIEAALSAGAPLEYEYRVVARDGATRWIHDRGEIVRDAAGRAEAWQGVMLDITARRAAECALAESERRFRGVLEHIRALAVVLDTGARVVWCNDHTVSVTGYAREELIGRGWRAALMPPEAPPVRRPDGTLPPHHEAEIVTRAGARRLIAWDTIALRDAAGVVTGSASIGRDITDEREMERRLRQAQKMEAVGRLAAGVAHDFNNVLAAITGYAQLLQGELAERAAPQGELEEILGAARRGAGLVQQLLAFARPRAHDVQVLDLCRVVEEFEPMLRPLMPPGVRVVLSSAAAPVRVRADRTQLEQVLLNLAVNARDAMPSGGTLTVQVAVRPAAGAEPARALLRVHDTGVGMPLEVRERLFEPFFTTKPMGAGTGLGLATVYAIVEQAGGTVSVDSAPGAGATFLVTLPLAAAAAGAGAESAIAGGTTVGDATVADVPGGDVTVADLMPDEAAEHVTAADAVGVGRAPWSALALRVLLVEDEEPVRNAVRRILERSGCEVRSACDGAEALDILARHPDGVDVLLTDLTMPAMGGVELAERAREVAAGVRVIVMSGYGQGAPAHGLTTGRWSYVQKPFSVEELTRAVWGNLPRAS